MKILVDSDIIIDILRGFGKTIKKMREVVGEELYISGITEMEILAGREAADREKRAAIEEFLSKFKKVNPNNQIFRIAGEFRRKYGISPADSIIAATTYWLNAKLWSKNVKDFKRIPDIRNLILEF